MSATPDRGVWLLVATLEGREHRWASVASTVDGVDYPAGLADLTVERGADSVDVSVYDPSIDWPSIALAIDGGEATLFRWTGGTPVAYASGELQVASYATRRDPVSLRIDRLPGAESLGRQIPDELAQVSEDTWPDAAAGAVVGDVGRYYPVILGYPGYLGTGTDTEPVVPVPLAQWATDGADTLAVVCEDGEQAITGVLIRNATVDAESVATVSGSADQLGRVVRVADFGSAPLVRPATADDSRVLYAGFYPAGGGGPRDGYSVLVYLLRLWGGTSVDWDRLPAIRDVVSPYAIDTWIDSPPTDPWAWFSGTVFGALPVEARTGPRGQYLVEKRYLSDPRRNVGTLVEGVSCTIASSVAVSDGPQNEFTARYRPGRDEDWLGSVLLTGRDGLASARARGTVVSTTVRSGRCSASVARYGPRQGDAVDLDWTWDESTAIRVLEVAAARDALPARLVSYLVPNGDQLEEGDEVTLTDPERGFSAVAAIVDGPPVASSTGVTVPLRVPS